MEAVIAAHFHYDSGNVGFGVGYGKSPYRPQWEFDYAEVEEPFIIAGRTFKAGEDIDMDDLKSYFATKSDLATLELMYAGEPQ